MAAAYGIRVGRGDRKMANFIKKAIKRPGRLTNAAHKAGKPIGEYARMHEHDPQGTIGDAARMYEHVLKPINKRAHVAPRKRG